MRKDVPLGVHLVAATHFAGGLAERLTGWTTDATGGEALAEFAGRACYQSWAKPNPKTATNAGYLAHIIEVGHLSVLEHASATFYLTGVSRAFTHELVRHRHLSYSQLSQRFVDESDVGLVVPPAYRQRQTAPEVLRATHDLLCEVYERLAAEHSSGLSRKQAREAARAVLPNMTETRIVVTGNFRAWREFVARRYDPAAHADAEIAEVAGVILDRLNELAPAAFGDLVDRFRSEPAAEAA